MNYQSTITIHSNIIIDEQTTLDKTRVNNDPSQLNYMIQTAHLRTMVEHHSINFPLNINKLVLSLILVNTTTTTLSNKPNTRNFTMQTITMNTTFNIIDYILNEPVRATTIDTVIHVTNNLFHKKKHAPFHSPIF
jgi:hypothetical protein